MPRRRAHVPSVRDMGIHIPDTGDFNRQVLGNTPKPKRASDPTPPPAARPPTAAAAARSASRRNMSYETAMALQEARSGDDSDLLPYQPTPSINPPRPRTLGAGYDSKTRTLRVRFRDGTPWEYYNVPALQWYNFQRVRSPGQFINRTLNNYEYGRGDF